MKPDFFNHDSFRVLTRPPVALMALDYGRARIGVALTNPEQTMSFAHKILRRPKRLQPLLEEIQKLTQEWRIGGLIIGYPLNASGTEGPMCQAVRQFGHHLHKMLELPIYMADERWTSGDGASDSQSAEKILKDVLKI